MALITHVGSIKNSNYNQSIEYLTHKHEEVTNRKGEIVKYEPVYDENGMLKERENYSFTYLKSDGTEGDSSDWSHDCNTTNLKFNKNLTEDERKAHHYVISHPQEDTQNGVTVEQAHRAAVEFCQKNFPGYQCLIATHSDTDNLHSHIVINSVRDREVEPQSWMTKGENGQIKPSQYEAGGKHTNTPQFRQHLMREVDAMCKERGFVMENYSNPLTRTKAQERMEYMHDSVVEAAKKSHNFKELQDNLQKEYNLRIETRGQAIRVFHPEMEKPKRIEHIGLTPYDLTPDMHKYYNMNPKNYEGVHEKWDDPEKRFEKSKKKEYDPDEGKLQLKNDEYSRKGWHDSRNFKLYSVSRFNDNGEPRSLLESTMILAYTIINGEIPEWAKTEKQRMAEEKFNERQKQVYMPREQKMQNLQQAIQYTKDLKIDTPEQLKDKLQNKDLSPEEKRKAEFVKEQYDLAGDKEYCYSKIFKKRQDELKGYSKEAIEAARRQLDEINKRNKHKKPKQDELEEYQREQETAHKASYFIMVNQARGRDRSDGPTK